MSALVVSLVGVGYACIGAFVTHEIWRRVSYRRLARQAAWWRAHCERCEQEDRASLRRISEVARDACDLNAGYAAYLADKIVITDPRTRRRERPTA